MSADMSALVLHGLGDVRYEQVPMPEPGPGQALIRVAAAGICGSDLPRIYEHGAYHYPLIPGHEVAGRVVALGPDTPVDAGGVAVDTDVVVMPLLPCGRCDYCRIGAYGQCQDYDYLGSRSDGGMAEYLLAPVANLLPLPTGLDPVDAALCEPAAVALHALRQGGVQPGDTVAILGCGAIGMLIAQWARIMGADEVLLVDVDDAKLELARRMWLGATVNSRTADPVALARRLGRGLGADLVIEAAGVPATFERALLMARPLGRVVIMGNPSADVTLARSTVSQLLRKELTLHGTWNSSFVALPTDEWRVTLRYLADRRIDVKPLITHRVPLSQGVQALEMMRRRAEPVARVVLING
ncbi:MAG: galactitol-1-phosphate 5-dehydrogenase [Anaerolineae bacterium]|jgi:L-iditol 2-dehydrogenase